MILNNDNNNNNNNNTNNNNNNDGDTVTAPSVSAMSSRPHLLAVCSHKPSAAIKRIKT